jgi:uncharacterized protein involved in outer membrane biogenesis
MKKPLLAIAVLIVVAAIGAGLMRYLSPEQVTRRAIEHAASDAIQASVRLDRVQISAADGTGVITGFAVGNPTGFRTPAALTADTIKMTVEVSSLDKEAVVVRTLSVISPQITYEPDGGGSNFTALLENIRRTAAAANMGEPGKKIIIDRLVIFDAKLRYPSPTHAGQTVTVDLPEIRLSSIGRVEGGTTSRALATAIVEALLYHAKRKIPENALQGGPTTGKQP